MFNFSLKKISQVDDKPITYQWEIDEHLLNLNQLIGKKISIEYTGRIQCVGCNRDIKKTFNQGYCFPCFKKLAQCDICMVRPETCHYSKGTCRDESWAQSQCFIPHSIYIANTSEVKVGITRSYRLINRWMEQGAHQAIEIGKVKSRLDAGLVEVELKKYFKDRTNWRKMLNSDHSKIDLDPLLQQCLNAWPSNCERIESHHKEHILNYPILAVPEKIKSINLEKTPLIEGKLTGLKGQYLIFDSGVLNIRKYVGYSVSLKI